MEQIQRVWHMDSLRSFCIRNNLYDAGTVRDYDLILNFVENTVPTEANIWIVAQDIKEHSQGRSSLSTADIAKRLEAQVVNRIPMSEWERRTIL